jgi:multidrug efflux pump subunit AcrB
MAFFDAIRPILMTWIAFIAGIIPLVFSSGAGAEMRYAMGVAASSSRFVL